MKERHEKAQAFLVALAKNTPELPFEPTLLPELFASTSANSLHSTENVAALVERSQGLASRILRVANSAYYGMQTAVSSLFHAIRILGLNEVRSIILQIGVTSALRKLNLPKGFPLDALWEHHVLTASLGRAIASSMPHGAVDADEVYAAGLLHDLGKTLLAANCPEDWLAILDIAECEKIPFHKAEASYWGVDHSVAGSRILDFWGLPQRLTEPVSWHHAPHFAKEDMQTATRVLAAANELSRLSLASVLQEGEDDAPPTLALPESAAALMPESVDMKKLATTIAACYDTARIPGLADAATGK